MPFLSQFGYRRLEFSIRNELACLINFFLQSLLHWYLPIFCNAINGRFTGGSGRLTDDQSTSICNFPAAGILAVHQSNWSVYRYWLDTQSPFFCRHNFHYFMTKPMKVNFSSKYFTKEFILDQPNYRNLDCLASFDQKPLVWMNLYWSSRSLIQNDW